MKILPLDLSLSLDTISSLDKESVLEKYEVSEDGLTKKEAVRRLKLFGPNVLREEKKTHIIFQFLASFKNPLVVVLLLVAAVSYITRSPVDATIVVSIIMLSAVLNFLQEYKASKAAEELKNKITTKVMVIRNGEKYEIPATDICVGDLCEFNAGDTIPADCRVISAKDFFVNQANLTGESFPVEKYSEPIKDRGSDLTSLSNIIFCGSDVVTGSSNAVVVKTGKDTQFGKIAEGLVDIDVNNEFTRGINSFSVMILNIIIFFVLFIFLANSLIKHDIYQSLMFSIAVAVGLTPEFLPMIMSVNMGRGSVSMSKKGVIVKKLTAIPTFGSMDILCTDKTGTLTLGKIKLVKYTDFFGRHSNKVLLHSYLNSYYQTGITNPLDEAVLDYGKLDISEYEKLDEIPFDFVRKRMSIVVKRNDRRVLITKGAPEEIFTVCKYYDNEGHRTVLDDDAAGKLAEQYYKLSSEGYRVVAVAEREDITDKKVYSKDDEKDLEVLGFIAFLDPPKQGVKEAIDRLEKLGVEVKVVTGDNEVVTQKICRDIGINIKGVMLSSELKTTSDSALRHKVNEVTIFARFSPEDKNRVIDALQANNHVVGYLGDGINDAVSLKSSDVGISVDNAVDVARESADIILTNKSLDILADGILEGRKAFGNTLKYIMMGISSNFGNMFSVLGAVLFLPYLPMLPIQILLNNFLYDFSQITIPTDNVDEEYTLKPKKWDMKFVKNFMFIFGPISSIYDYLAFILMYFVFKAPANVFHTAWFMESLATQTFVIYIIRTRKLPFIESKPSKALIISTVLSVAVGWIIPFTFLGRYLGFVALPINIILVLVVLVVLYLVCVEVGKRLFYKRYSII